MTIGKEKLKALAEAAGPKDYFAPRPYEEDRYYDDQEINRLEFMAEADPATILALLAEIEHLRENHEKVCTNYNRASFASEERGKQIDQLKAENEALRKDAERYRWLRSPNRSCYELDSVFDEFGVPLDDKIDASMAKEAK